MITVSFSLLSRPVRIFGPAWTMLGGDELSVTRYSLLVTGCWLLVTRCWSSLLITEVEQLDIHEYN
ncbi:MAG: hypothetical protein HQK59_17535 [Deltaproteobacteria bacterium]|nr:hypothetical protein [Deltaproteobacteria bacterium]